MREGAQRTVDNKVYSKPKAGGVPPGDPAVWDSSEGIGGVSLQIQEESLHKGGCLGQTLEKTFCV